MALFAICIVLRILKGKHLRHYVNYCKAILSPNVWKLLNRIDFTDVVKRKKSVAVTVLDCDV